MKKKWSLSQIGIGMVGGLLGLYIVAGSDLHIPDGMQNQIMKIVHAQAETFFLPGMQFIENKPLKLKDQIAAAALRMIPLGGYVEGKSDYETEVEDEDTYRRILELQGKSENEVDENGQLVENQQAQTDQEVPRANQSEIDLSVEKLRDFDYLISNFYTVDSTTMIGPEQLNVDDLLSRSMKIQSGGQEPKVLIFHTHSQETFVDSVPDDPSTSIVGIGDYLTQLLNAKGIPTIHDTGVYDLIDGKLDRSSAYEYSESAVRQILAENPSVEVVIDLHRDGVREETHLVTDVNGKQTAQIMFFNGLSRTRANGDISYLENPYIQDNLAFSLQMQLASEQLHPGFARHIYLKAYRYSLHMMPKSLLVEAGAQTNTVEEMKNAMEVLADTLHNVLAE